MKLVKQKHSTGCGVACVAMLAGITYRQAMSIVHPFRFPFTKATTKHKDLDRAFAKLGWKHTIYSPNRAWAMQTLPTYNEKLILIIKNDDGKTHHGVIWDPETRMVLDPYGDKPFEYYQENLYQIIAVEMG